jgi:hypothetical protein
MKLRRVGKTFGRANARPVACPPLRTGRWWARRKSAFAHPTGFAILAAGCYGESMLAWRIIIGISGPASA